MPWSSLCLPGSDVKGGSDVDQNVIFLYQLWENTDPVGNLLPGAFGQLYPALLFLLEQQGLLKVSRTCRGYGLMDAIKGRPGWGHGGGLSRSGAISK